MSKLLHDDTTVTVSGPGTVSGDEIVVDLGQRILSGIVRAEGFVIVGRAVEDFLGWSIEVADESLTPNTPGVFREVDRRRVPTDSGANSVVWDVFVSNQIWPIWKTTPPAAPYLTNFYARYLRAGLIVEKGPGIAPQPTLDLTLTLFDSPDVIVQTFPTPTLGANSYVSVPDALLRLTQISPNLVSFAILGPERQGEILISATERIELEVVKICEPKGSSPRDPDVQRILWPRDNAYPAIGPLIVEVLPSWINGILIYVDEMAEAEIFGEEASEPEEDVGLSEIEIDSEGAQYSERWAGREGFQGSFFHSRRKIIAELAKSFPGGLPV